MAPQGVVDPVKMAQIQQCACILQMMLLPAKQASEPSPKLIILATHTHDNNGGRGIAMLQLVTQDHQIAPQGVMYSVKMAQIG